MKAYLSMPITGHDINERKAYADKMAAVLIEKDKSITEVITPFSVPGYEDGHTWEWYLCKDLEAILHCGIIALAPGYDKSRGCQMELEWANHHDKSIYTILDF